MKQENQRPNLLVRVLRSAVLAAIIAIAGLLWAIYSTRSEDRAWQQQLDSQATQIANQRLQIDLNAEQNRLLSERATVDTQETNIESKLQTPFPLNNGDFAITATALSAQVNQVESTRQAIEARQQQIEATQTSVARTQDTLLSTNVPIVTQSPFMELPVTFNGTFDQYNYETYQMVFHIERIYGQEFTGKLHWPSLRNSITQIEGEFVQDFGDIIQQSKWSFIYNFDTDKSGIWLRFTETKILQGSGIQTNNLYLARLKDDGTMLGVYFSNDQISQPGGDFEIIHRP